MKSFIENLFIRFESATQSTGDHFLKTSGISRKRKANRHLSFATLSPECYNLRGVSKKAGDQRRTPAP